MLFCCFIPSLSVPNGVGYNLRTNKGRAIHIYKLHFLRPTETASLFIRSRSKCSRRKRKYDFEYCCSIQKVNSGSSESFEAGDGNTVFLIDALALIYRSHFALARSGLRTSYGLETGPIYGFISTFVSLLETYKASCAMVVFDSYYFPPYVSSESTPWQRRALYPDYKKNRSKMPTAIEKSLPYIKALVSALGISIVEVASTEADDVIGSLVKYCSSNSFSSNIVSADKDFLQLLDESYCSILRPRTTNKTTKGGSAIQKDGGNLPSWTLITESDFRNTFDNLSPLQYCDVLALVGDPVDNIPGVAGIGEKQAVALVKNFGSIESLVENWKVISSPRLREKIFHHRELLLLSKTLVTIHQDLNIPNFDISDVFIRPPQLEKINYIMDKLEFKKLKERVDRYVKSSCSSELSPIKRNWSYSHVENARSENGQHKGGVEQCCDRIDKFRKLGIQCLFLSTLVNYDVAEDKWEQLLSSVRTQSTEVPFITFWTDYDVDPAERGKHKKRVLLDDSNSGTILENKWKIPDNDNFPFQDVVVIRGIVISWEGSSSVYLDLENTKVVWVQQLEWLLCHSPISKVSIFVKKQIHALQRWNRNCSLKFPFVDILIGHHAAAPFESLSVSQVMKRYAMLSGDLDTLAMTELMFSTMDEEALHEFRREALKLISCQVEVLSSSFVDLFRVWFQCHWAVLLFRATKFLNAELAMLSMKSFVEYIEYPLIQVLATMEANGLYVNMEKLVEMNHKERRRSQSSKEKLQKVTQSFQDNVTTYDSDTLATEMWNIECKKYESSSIAIASYRNLSTWERKSLQSLYRNANPVSGKIHLFFYKDAQSFGKLATSSLDLQQGLFKNEADRVKSLIVAPKGSQILVADCTQIEMRILAALSSEPSWIQAFLENGDIHQLIAKQLQTFENSNKEFSEIQFRDYAKIISYSLMRGTSEQNISKVLKIPRQRIQSWMKFYRDTFCKVTKFLEEISEKGFRRGYSETLLGRRIPIPFTESQNYAEISFAKNIARRAPVEGTQSDMLSLAIIQIQHKLGEFQESKLILQVGDCIIFQVAQSDVDKVMKMVTREVSDILPLPQSVPIHVRIGVGNNWLQATKALQ